MSTPLDYGRPPSRRHWRVLIVALLHAGAAWYSVRSWRLYRARFEDRRLYLEQVKIRQEYDREFERQFQLPRPATNPAATQP
jgi:hypothetical protein